MGARDRPAWRAARRPSSIPAAIRAAFAGAMSTSAAGPEPRDALDARESVDDLSGRPVVDAEHERDELRVAERVHALLERTPHATIHATRRLGRGPAHAQAPPGSPRRANARSAVRLAFASASKRFASARPRRRSAMGAV